MTVDQWQATARKVMNEFHEENILGKLENNQIKLDSVPTYHQVQRLLTVNNILYHSQALPDERTLKVLLRGILSSTKEQTIKEELNNIGFSISHIRQFINGRKLSMFMVSFLKNLASKEIFDLKSIFLIAIRVEPYKTSGAAQ